MTDPIEKPDCTKPEHLDFLDNLRESEETSMFGARPYLTRQFPNLSNSDALKILGYWMQTYTQKEEIPMTAERSIVDLWIEWANLAVQAIGAGIDKAIVERHVPKSIAPSLEKQIAFLKELIGNENI